MYNNSDLEMLNWVTKFILIPVLCLLCIILIYTSPINAETGSKSILPETLDGLDVDKFSSSPLLPPLGAIHTNYSIGICLIALILK